jgi:hypothetical protein
MFRGLAASPTFFQDGEEGTASSNHFPTWEGRNCRCTTIFQDVKRRNCLFLEYSLLIISQDGRREGIVILPFFQDGMEELASSNHFPRLKRRNCSGQEKPES